METGFVIFEVECIQFNGQKMSSCGTRRLVHIQIMFPMQKQSNHCSSAKKATISARIKNICTRKCCVRKYKFYLVFHWQMLKCFYKKKYFFFVYKLKWTIKIWNDRFVYCKIAFGRKMIHVCYIVILCVCVRMYIFIYS